jgi:hypothetical protein
MIECRAALPYMRQQAERFIESVVELELIFKD